jgi:hypothetical protein
MLLDFKSEKNLLTNGDATDCYLPLVYVSVMLKIIFIAAIIYFQHSAR